MSCLSDDEVADWVDGRLDGDATSALTRHIDGCAACRALVAGAARALEGDDEPPPPRIWRVGQTVGRYVIDAPVGIGGTGLVYAAHDLQLGRRVALKQLRRDSLDERPAAERNLLLREAQALARLSHPNVVALYDATLVDDQLVLAMELVQGATLRRWLEAAPREADAVVAVLAQACRGLFAAHQAGLAHRDVKPDNILVGDDGRVRVTDFGLARVHGERGARGSAGTGALTETISGDGLLVGTPAYMPPEQLDGAPLDVRSDVFAFCVTAWEALFGARPFNGDDVVALRAAIDAGPPEPPRRGPRGPVRAQLRRLLVRGLAADPTARPATLQPLLDEMSRRPSSLTARLLAGALVVGALATLGFVDARRAASRCTGGAGAWGAVWSDRVRDATRVALVHGAGDASPFAALDRAFARYADGWIAAHQATCELHARGELSASGLDARMVCLGDARAEAAALVRVLDDAGGHPVLAADALAAVRKLEPVDRCTSLRAADAVADAVPPTPAARAERDRLAAAAAEVHALWTTRRYEACVTRADALVPAAERVRDVSLLPRLLYDLGRCQEWSQGPNASIPTIHRSAESALHTRDRWALAQAWIRLVFLFGYRLRDEAASQQWRHYAEGALVGLDDPTLRAALDDDNGIVDAAFGHYAAAEDELQAGLAAARQRLGPDAALTRELETTLANLWMDTGWPTRAVPVLARGLAAAERENGRDAPMNAWTLANYVSALVDSGDRDAALALVPRLRALLPADPMRDCGAWLHHRIAAALRLAGDAAGALVDDRAAVAACANNEIERQAWLGVGSDLLALGRPRAAVAPLESAVATPATESEAGDAEFALAQALWDGGGDRTRARAQARHARARIAVVAAALHGPGFERQLAAVDTWLAAHP